MTTFRPAKTLAAAATSARRAEAASATTQPGAVTDSVIVLTWNGLPATKACLASLRQNCGEEVEVIVVDQASTDGTVGWLSASSLEWPALRVEFLPRNLGFAGGCNRGARLARGNRIWFVNNDIVVGNGWLEAMRAALDSDPEIVAVGPMTDYTGELQWDWEGYVDRVYPKKFQEHVDRRLADWRGKLWRFPRVAGLLLGIRREIFEEIGGFSEAYPVGMFEDDDLCLRLRRRGLRLAVVPSVFVHHIGGYSFRRGKIDAHLRMDLNRRQFVASIKPFEEAADGPLVSVVITTFNRKGLLAKALRSVVEQSYRNWEALVVNDGGVPVRDLIDGFGDKRIRLFEREHAGRAPALNFALANIRGSLVAYLDDDDLWRANHLGVLVAAQRESGAQLVYSSGVEHLSRRRGDDVEILDSRVISDEFNLERLLDVNQMPNCCVLHEAAVISEVGLFDERLASLEDWDYWRRIAATNEIIHVPAVTAEFNVWLDFSSRNGLKVRNSKRYLSDVRAISLKPISAGETSEWMRLRANQLIAFGLVEDGHALLTRASDRNPLNAHATLDLISLERRRGGTPSPAVVARLERVATWHAQEYGLWSALASELIAIGEYRRAEDALALALVTRVNDSQATEAYVRLAECYARQGYTDSAGACRAKAAELRDPKLRVKGAGRLLRPRLARFVYQARQSYRLRGLRASARSAVRFASARFWRLVAA